MQRSMASPSWHAHQTRPGNVRGAHRGREPVSRGYPSSKAVLAGEEEAGDEVVARTPGSA
jgi:hypothetical protein